MCPLLCFNQQLVFKIEINNSENVEVLEISDVILVDDELMF